MEKTEIIIPKGIEFISDWKEYVLPKGHCIVDKGITGCGYTEMCLRNEKNISIPKIFCKAYIPSGYCYDINYCSCYFYL